MTAVGDIRGTTSHRRAVISLFRRLRSAEGQANPLPFWEELRALGDVVPSPWGGYFVTSFEACSQVLRSRDWLVPDFAWQERQPDPRRWHELATQELSGTLSRLNPPAHTCQRRALGNPFDRATLEDLRPRIAAFASVLLDDLEDRLRTDGEADFVHVVGELLRRAHRGRGIHREVEQVVRPAVHGGLVLHRQTEQSADDEHRVPRGELGHQIGGASIDEDQRRIEAVLDEIGSEAQLAVDANGRFDLETAIAYAKMLRQYPLFWYEEIGDPLDYQLQAAMSEFYPGPIRRATEEEIRSNA